MKNIAAVLFLSMFMFSCSSTNIISSWTNETYESQPYKKVLVLAVSEKLSDRTAFEGNLVKALREEGVNAFSSLSLFPKELSGTPPSKEVITAALVEQGVDGIFIISLADIKEEERYVPPTTYTEPVRTYNNQPSYHHTDYPYYNTGYYNYYSTQYRTVTEPGYTINTTYVYLETNFYNVEKNMLVWTAQSESIDPTSASKLSDQYTKVIVRAMHQDRANMK